MSIHGVSGPHIPGPTHTGRAQEMIENKLGGIRHDGQRAAQGMRTLTEHVNAVQTLAAEQMERVSAKVNTLSEAVAGRMEARTADLLASVDQLIGQASAEANEQRVAQLEQVKTQVENLAIRFEESMSSHADALLGLLQGDAADTADDTESPSVDLTA